NERYRERGDIVATALAEVWQHHGSWEPFRGHPRLLSRVILSAHEAAFERPANPPDDEQPPPPHPVHLRMLLLDADGQLVTGRDRALVPINSEGRVVGWLAVAQLVEVRSGFEREFLRRQRIALLLIGLAASVVAALLALVLARNLVKPIRALARGTHELTQGNYALELPTGRSDELGALARDFNELARTLDANESSRKRWLADISHELRTPLAILRGEIEAMLDGVRPLDRERLLSVQQEVQHMNRLVEDLHALTIADIGGLQYRKAECDVAELWRDLCDSLRPRFAAAQLSLHT